MIEDCVALRFYFFGFAVLRHRDEDCGAPSRAYTLIDSDTGRKIILLFV